MRKSLVERPAAKNDFRLKNPQKIHYQYVFIAYSFKPEPISDLNLDFGFTSGRNLPTQAKPLKKGKSLFFKPLKTP